MKYNTNTDLWDWFELSYASWLTMPRVLLHSMPVDWQNKLAELLNEYDAMFPNQPDICTRVQVTKGNKLIKTPEWLINYRHPDTNAIDNLKPLDN